MLKKTAEAPIYDPYTELISQSEIDLDIELIGNLLRDPDSDHSIAALKVYEEGAFSWPYADLTIKDGLPIELDKGAAVSGISALDEEVHGKVLHHVKAGSKLVSVQYVLSDSHGAGHQCHSGANPSPNLKGCFGSMGSIEIEGYAQKIHYSYNQTADNKSYRSLKLFSTLAKDRMKPCSKCRYYHDYQQFLDYYDDPLYADKWTGAAFSGDSVSFRHGGANFTGLDANGRADIVEKSAAFLSTFMFTIRQMEESVLQCQEDCGQHKCTDTALSLLDSSVAFYTGSLVQTKGSGEGKLIYSLADQLCKDFKTCDISGDKTKGTSSVNHKAYEYFNQMQQDLLQNNCPAARNLKSRIAHQMFLPLVQATLRSAYVRDSTQSSAALKDQASGATYAASVLPMVHKCNVDDARVIYENMKTGSEGTSFSQVKEAFERNYRCLGITCEEVGGFWRESKGEYHFGAEPCVTDTGKDLDLEKHLPIAGITIFLMGVGFYLYSRYRLEQRRKRLARYDEENDLSESSNDDLIFT